jgi:hypothetical protein
MASGCVKDRAATRCARLIGNVLPTDGVAEGVIEPIASAILQFEAMPLCAFASAVKFGKSGKSCSAFQRNRIPYGVVFLLMQ